MVLPKGMEQKLDWCKQRNNRGKEIKWGGETVLFDCKEQRQIGWRDVELMEFFCFFVCVCVFNLFLYF